MKPASSVALSISYLAWINARLKAEIAKREQEVRRNRLSHRLRSLMLVLFAGLSLTTAHLFG